MVTLEAKNIKLPSANRRLIMGRGRMVMNPQYKLSMHAIAYDMLSTMKSDGPRPESPYSVKIKLKTYLDLDNCLKAILDILEHIGIIDNDRNVVKLDVSKETIKRGQPDSIYIEVRGTR